MSNRSRQLRSYLPSWGALGCFGLAPGCGRLVRTWPFPALEPLGMEGARTFVVRANALPKKRWEFDASQKPRRDRFLQRGRLPAICHPIKGELAITAARPSTVLF
jgi:hypothetical protein